MNKRLMRALMRIGLAMRYARQSKLLDAATAQKQETKEPVAVEDSLELAARRFAEEQKRRQKQ